MKKFYPYTSTGRVIYDPPRPGTLKENGGWVIITADQEITRYFRWWVDKMINNPLALDKQDLIKPAFDAHITVVRGGLDVKGHEKRVNSVWKRHHGKKVTFKYGINVRETRKADRDTGKLWFVDVQCDMWQAIRDEMGFTNTFNPHLTIGKYR